MRAVLTARLEKARPAPCPLSERELDVLRLAAAGKSDREIVKALDLSPKTVETYLQRIYAKLGVRNQSAAVACPTRVIPWPSGKYLLVTVPLRL